MADVLQGKDCVLMAYKDGGYYPFVCAQTVDFNLSTELLPSTSINSGTYRTFQPRLSEWGISLSGVTRLRDTSASAVFVLDTIADQVRQSGMDIRLLLTDEGGYVRRLEGHVYIPQSNITGTVGQVSKFGTEFKGSGPLVLDQFITIQPGSVNTYSAYATGGETYIQDALFLGAVVHWVEISDTVADVILSGTPTGRQVKHDVSTGRIDFARPLGQGEFYKILYSR